MTGPVPPRVTYAPPTLAEGPVARLTLGPQTPFERSFVFGERLVLGRMGPTADPSPGFLLVDDPTVSSRHFTITRRPDGRFFIRDSSRNGTRVDGLRLMPNLEVEINGGQVITVGRGLELRLEAETASSATGPLPAAGTLAAPETRTATVLVGDIRNYTVLVRTTPSELLQRSVTRVFEELERDVLQLKGTVKEYQGDSLLAFWEAEDETQCASAACSAVLALDRRVRQLAGDPSVWGLSASPLGMDWALATGQVVLSSFGAHGPSGLSLVGEPVVRAYRIEKHADATTGPIVVCAATRRAARAGYCFRDLGERTAKGFDRPESVFALEGALPDETKTQRFRLPGSGA